MGRSRCCVLLAIGFAVIPLIARAAEPSGQGAIESFGGEVLGSKGPLENTKVRVTYSESASDPRDAANIAGGIVLRSEVYTTDADGRYRVDVPAELAGNPHLRVSLAFSHPEYLGRTIGPVPVADFSGREIETGAAYWSHRQLARQAMAHTRLRPGKPLSGRVLTADGAPAAGAMVSTRTKYQAYSWKFLSADDYSSANFAVADDQGRFATVTDAQASLEIELPGHAPLLISDLAKYPGTDGPDPTFMLPPGFLVRGRVFTVAGEPIAGAIVVARRDAPWNEADMPLPLVRTCAADRFGNFQLPPLPADRYRFSVDTRVADPAKIEEYNQHHDVPTVPLSDVLLDETRQVGGPLDLDLRAVETVSVTARIEFPDGRPPASERPVDLAVTGTMEGRRWSGISARADDDGMAQLIVPRGVEDLVIETGLARHRRSQDSLEQIGTAIHLGTITDDVSGLVVVKPRLATLKVKLKLPRGFDAANPKAHIYITAAHRREGYLRNKSAQQRVPLSSGMQTNNNAYRAIALPNEEIVLRVTKTAGDVETVLHEERLTLDPGEERLREITIVDRPR